MFANIASYLRGDFVLRAPIGAPTDTEDDALPPTESSRDQIYEALRTRILDRAPGYRPGDRLPTQESIAAVYKVSTATVGRAIDLLKHDGLVRTSGGSGTVVIAAD